MRNTHSYYIIINPASKSGRGMKIWAKLQPVLQEEGIDYKAAFSERIGHVTELVRRLTARYLTHPEAEPLRLIILGGDGTINEALQGISRFDKVYLGYIPTGSSNDLARDLKLPKNPADILHNILRCGNPMSYDIGRLQYEAPNDEGVPDTRLFTVSAGIGFDAAVCREAMTSRFKDVLNKLGFGKLTYMVIALKQIVTAKSVSCDLYLDDQEPIHLDRFLFITEMVHQYEGGGFKFCPGADPADGLLEVCSVGRIPKCVILLALPSAFWGKHTVFSGVERYQAARIRIVASAPLWVHTDGEVYLKSDRIYLTCEKRKLLLLL